MEGTPPVDRFIDDGYIDDAYDGKHGSRAGTGGRSTHVAAQHHISDVNKPEDQGCGQAGIPCPPCSPGRSSPDGAGYEGEGDKDGSYFSRGLGQPVPAFIFLPEIADTGYGQNTEGQHADPGYRDMEIEDALGDAFYGVGRYIQEDHADRGHHAYKCEGEQYQGGYWGAGVLSLCSNGAVLAFSLCISIG